MYEIDFDLIEKYSIDLTEDDYKATHMKNKIHYIESGGFSKRIFIKQLLLYSVLITDLLIAFNGMLSMSNVFFNFIFLIYFLVGNIFLFRSGKFIHDTKYSLYRFKFRDVIKDLSYADLGKCQFRYMSRIKHDDEYFIKIISEIENEILIIPVSMETYKECWFLNKGNLIYLFYYLLDEYFEIMFVLDSKKYDKELIKINKKRLMKEKRHSSIKKLLPF